MLQIIPIEFLAHVPTFYPVIFYPVHMCSNQLCRHCCCRGQKNRHANLEIQAPERVKSTVSLIMNPLNLMKNWLQYIHLESSDTAYKCHKQCIFVGHHSHTHRLCSLCMHYYAFCSCAHDWPHMYVQVKVVKSIIMSKLQQMQDAWGMCSIELQFG